MASGPELTNEQEIVMRFKQLLEERNALSSAAIERGTEVAEHDLVIRTLQPLDGSRKCYRLFGDVLVERTVSEVLPSVQEQKSNLASVREMGHECAGRRLVEELHISTSQ